MLKAVTTVAGGGRGTLAWSSRLRSLLDVRFLALFTAAATYGLIVLGGVVRVTDSGLACPDWPLCHGQVIPPLNKHVLIEYSHRLAAASVGLLVLGTAITAWAWHRDRPLVAAGSALALALLIVQVLVGGITVEMDLPDTIVALHLGIALFLLATLLVTAVAAFSPKTIAGTEEKPDNFIGGWSVAAFATLALILTGSYVANSGAALVYPDWPLFDGKLVSAGGRLADLHYAHRLIAVVVGVLVSGVAVHTWRSARTPMLLIAVGVAVTVYWAQVFVGASNIWFDLPTSVRIAHLALAAALWATLVVGGSWIYVQGKAMEEARNAG